MNRIKFDPPAGTKVHPALDLVPLMTEDEFARLVWSVRKIGQVDEIVQDEAGVIYDGRCRLMACEIAKVEPRLTRPKDPVAAFVFARNIARRHLNQGQCAIITVMMMDLEQTGVEGVGFIHQLNIVRRHLTPSQLHIADAMFEEPDYPENLVLPEARLILQYPDLRDGVIQGTMGGLPKAHEIALKYQAEAARAREQAERLGDLRKASPYIGLQVDEAHLTLDEGEAALGRALAVAEEKAAEPVLAEHAGMIRAIGKRVVGDLVEIGRRLSECKTMLRHGGWLPWLEREFGWSSRTAENYVNLYQLSLTTKFETISDLDIPLTGLYRLAAPSTPEALRNDILTRAREGEAFSADDIRAAIAEMRGTPAKVSRSQALRDLCERMTVERPDDPLVDELRRLVAE